MCDSDGSPSRRSMTQALTPEDLDDPGPRRMAFAVRAGIGRRSFRV